MTVLATRRYGDPAGPALLALHGMTGHARRWERLGRERWAHRDVIAVDLRGHGDSTWDPPWTLAQLVDDVADTLDDLDIGVVDVVGHSYGAVLALHLMAQAPARVRRAVLLDPGLLRVPGEMRREVDAVLAADGFADIESAVAARSATLTEWAAETPHPDVALEIAHHLEPGTDGRFRFRYHRAVIVNALSEICRPVPAVARPRPTLLVAARRNRIVTDDVVAALRATLGGALELVALDCGHMVAWERFDDVAALVDGFLVPSAQQRSPARNDVETQDV